MHASRSVLLLVLAIASAPSLAQFPGGGIDGAHNSRNESRPLREPSRSDAISPGATIQAQLDAIEDSLKLTEAQRAAWFAFSDPVQKLGDMMSRLRFDARVGLPPSGGALEQLDKGADDERGSRPTPTGLSCGRTLVNTQSRLRRRFILDAFSNFERAR